MGNPSNELNHALVTFSVVAPFATGHYVLNQITHTIIYTVKAVVTESTISAIAFFTVVTGRAATVMTWLLRKALPVLQRNFPDKSAFIRACLFGLQKGRPASGFSERQGTEGMNFS